MKYLTIIALILALFMVSCRVTKKAQRVQKQIQRLDTTKVVIVKPDQFNEELDSLQKIMVALDSQKIDNYESFSAKAKVDYQGANNSGNANANIRIKKDSIIWISLTGTLNIEGFRVMIKPDSLIIMDKLNHKLIKRSISYIKEVTNIALSFQDIQNIIIGNPLFTKGNITSYKHVRNNWFLNIKSNELNNFVTVLSNNRKLILKNTRLEDSVNGQVRVCDMTLGGYKLDGDSRFSENRRILITDKTKLEIKIQFKQHDFNVPVSFPFSIPKNYDEN